MTVVLMMGVSGSGKTTASVLLAAREGWQMLEGDSLHPPANIEKMRHGFPLTDKDRWPWLQAIAAEIDRWRVAGISGVVACSALKRSYRDLLINGRQRCSIASSRRWRSRDRTNIRSWCRWRIRRMRSSRR